MKIKLQLIRKSNSSFILSFYLKFLIRLILQNTLQMGIKGLLPHISAHINKKHISSQRNHRIGIDGHAWLNLILPCIALQLHKGVKTTLHHDIFMKRIEKLKKFGILPVVVFDGCELPCKEIVNTRRRTRIEETKKSAEIAMKKGNVKEAEKHIIASISVSKEMTEEIAQFIKAKDINVIISPYESDAQLSYLQKINYIHPIITEDRDLIVYNCNNILYKYNGEYVRHYERNVLKAKDTFFI